jgi:hypothetical protein|nr:MAG TPA: hypothetical protein [Caudoviricetes sp.]
MGKGKNADYIEAKKTIAEKKGKKGKILSLF